MSNQQGNTYEIREYRPGDELSIVETFNRVFTGDDGRFGSRDLENWRWAYERNPAGWRIFVALHEGRVVSQCAAWPFRTILEGRETIFAQGVDSMTDPRHRAGLKRPGLFVNTAMEFFDRYGGADRDVVHYGMPIEQAFKMGYTFLKYEVVRTQLALVLTHVDPPDALPPGVERIERFDEQARWLYDRCSGAFGASAIRDDAFLDWRFSRPGARYTTIGVRDGDGVLRGYAVFRRAEFAGQELGVVCDWLVPPDEVEVAELLELGLRRLAAEEGAVALALVVPDWSPWFAWFQERLWRVYPTSYTMCSRQFARRYDPRWLRDHWWYTLADTDIV
ncbi:MAG: GNAT family N-acetyltransferase [Planctomycetota bacterium]